MNRFSVCILFPEKRSQARSNTRRVQRVIGSLCYGTPEYRGKLRSTRVGNTPLLSFVQAIRRAEEDRIYLYMDAEAKRIVKDHAEFGSAPGHPAKGDIPAHPDSWKHKHYPTGNLQLSFSREPENLNGALVCSVDVDIDLERGLGHVVEWLDNNVFKKNKTDQARIYALLFGQGITPYYRLTQPNRLRTQRRKAISRR